LVRTASIDEDNPSCNLPPDFSLPKIRSNTAASFAVKSASNALATTFIFDITGGGANSINRFMIKNFIEENYPGRTRTVLLGVEFWTVKFCIKTRSAIDKYQILTL
jgi:hypothetical protein